MPSPSLPTSKKRTAKAKALPVFTDQDMRILFADWFPGRTEQSNKPAGWTPETKLLADFQAYVEAHGHDAEIGLEDMREMLAEKNARTRKMLVTVMGTVRQEYADCWNRMLLRAIRVAA